MSLIANLRFGELGEWCAERFTGSAEVARRVTVETKDQRTVRPAGSAGRRHWARVDRAFALRVATLVQPAPPYSALYGLVRSGLVRREWAHRQAARYPTHARLPDGERRRALDLRPTSTGWLDLTGERSVDIPFDKDGRSTFASFDGFSSEPMLGDFLERTRAYLATHAPLGRLGAEKGVACDGSTTPAAWRRCAAWPGTRRRTARGASPGRSSPPTGLAGDLGIRPPGATAVSGRAG